MMEHATSPPKDIVSSLIINRKSYIQARNASKLTLPASFFMLFKSIVGLGVFSIPYVYSKVGIGYGVILGFFVCYITTYGLYSLANLANQVEAKESSGTISQYHDLVDVLTTKALGPKAGKRLSTTILTSNVMNNGCTMMGAIIEISHIMAAYYERDMLYFKLGIIATFFILSALIIEPEKLKPYAYVSSLVVIAIALIMVINNIINLLPNNIDPSVSYTMWDISHAGIYFGIAGFAYGASGTLFTGKSL
jgi:amino acid permease